LPTSPVFDSGRHRFYLHHMPGLSERNTIYLNIFWLKGQSGLVV
jgi:hypothetical protein